MRICDMRTGISFKVSAADRRRLKAIVRDRNAPQKHVWRANIILSGADGAGTAQIMRETGKSKTCVWRWQERFMQEGVEGLLHDKTRPSRIPPLAQQVIDTVAQLTLEPPPGETTHWTAAMMAKQTGISQSAVRRIWRTHGLQPHRMRQIQALDRTQPGLPLKPGRAGTMTHDYKRNGTTTLFAALNVLDGTVIAKNMQRHRHQEFIRFLREIERQVPVGKLIHVVLDNYAAHKHPKVREWLVRHPRWTFHFVPTSCSWLNAVEGFFAKLTKRRLKRGVFHSVVDLQEAINRFLVEHNGTEAKPFNWTADPDKIIAAVKRGHQVLDSNH